MKYKIFSISESAITIDFGNEIDEKTNDFVIHLCKICEENPIIGLIEIVPAYSSLSVFYDIFQIKKQNKSGQSAFDFVKNWVEEIIKSNNLQTPQFLNSKTHTIPVIYNGEDLKDVAEFNHLTIEAVIEIHTNPIYKVFMMGFLPGFAYLGGMDKRISIPRKPTPRTIVKAGSVGIAGNQTGIYPLESPGGWQLIGQTDIKLFRPNNSSPTLLKTGDFVRFHQDF